MSERVTDKQFTQFLEEKGALNSCISCGQVRWINKAEDEDGVIYSLVLAQTPEVRNLRSGLGAFISICANCGFVRHYYRMPVVRWLEARGEEQSE